MAIINILIISKKNKNVAHVVIISIMLIDEPCQLMEYLISIIEPI